MPAWRRRFHLLQVRQPARSGAGRLDLPARGRLAFGSGTAIFLLLVVVLVAGQADGQILVGPYTFKNITGPTSTLIKSTGGVLHLVTINTGSPGTIILLDSATCPGPGKTIGTIWGTVALTVPQTVFYDVSFENGLCVVTSAGSDVTVSWR